MSRGRPSKPTQLKVLQGTFRKDRDDHGASSAKPVGVPKCPAWLSKQAKKYWKEVGPELAKSGLISTLDGAAFATLCDSVGLYEEVTRKIESLEDLADTTPNGMGIQSVCFQIRNKLIEQIRALSSDFGLTPVSAGKIKAPEQKQLGLDGFEDL